MIWGQVLVRELHVIIREFASVHAVGAGPKPQPVLQVAGRLGTERQCERLLERPLARWRFACGILEHDFGRSEFGTGERQIVEFHLCFFVQPGGYPIKRIARISEDIPRALASIHAWLRG